MELIGSACNTSVTLFKAGIQRKLVVTGLRKSNRYATIYAFRIGREPSKAQIDVVNRVMGDADERGFHLRRAIEHIAEMERIDREAGTKEN